MRTEHFHFRIEDEEMIPCVKADATHTKFAYKDVLEDGSEYGLAMTLTEVTSEPTPYMNEVAERALEAYRIEHGP